MNPVRHMNLGRQTAQIVGELSGADARAAIAHEGEIPTCRSSRIGQTPISRRHIFGFRLGLSQVHVSAGSALTSVGKDIGERAEIKGVDGVRHASHIAIRVRFVKALFEINAA